MKSTSVINPTMIYKIFITVSPLLHQPVTGSNEPVGEQKEQNSETNVNQIRHICLRDLVYAIRNQKGGKENKKRVKKVSKKKMRLVVKSHDIKAVIRRGD